jgi:ribosomal protein S18 acetylase RimI-like enzyme
MESSDGDRGRLTGKFTIRQFIFPQDYPAVYQLWETAGSGIHVGDSDTPDEIKKKLERDPDLFLLAEIDGQVIGSVMGGFDGRRGMIYHLAVQDAFRGHGIATALMNELETRLRAKGCLKYYLLVTYENLKAIRYYEGHGWERMALHAYGKKLS